MWAYIMAAARGDRRASPPRRDAHGPTSELFRNYRFPLRSMSGSFPSLHRLPRVSSVAATMENENRAAAGAFGDKAPPVEMKIVDQSVNEKIGDAISPLQAEEGQADQATMEASRTSPLHLRVARWARDRWRFAIRSVQRRLGRGERTPPRSPDWFLDKFAAGSPPTAATFDLPGETFYVGEPSRWLCGAKLCFDPSLNIHYRWLALVSLAVLYNIVFVIGRAVFWELNNVTPVLWFVLDYLSDAIYLFDIFVHAHEGYLDQGLLVRDSNKLRSFYFKSGKWKCDILSILPTDIAYAWWPPAECQVRVPCPVIVRMNRLARLPRMWEWFERTETATGYPNAFRICKVVLAILILIHWNACFYFGISYGIGFGTDNWVYNLNGPRNSTLARQYIYSFYWSTLTLTTIGETPQPENDAEYLFVVADFLAGVLIFATIVGNIGSMISNMNVSRVDFQNRMDGVKQYMAFRKVGGELEARVIRWFAYTWQQSGALDEEHVLSALPDKLKAEIAIRVHLDTLRQVRIFQDCEPGLLEALVLKLRLQVFSPGDYICRKGDVGKEMYIVKRGRLQVVGDDGKSILATLSAGSVFGEVSVLEIAGNRTGNRRTANVRSLGYSDLFCLAKRDLWDALADYPDARISLTERGCQLLRKDGLLDENIYGGAQTNQRSLEVTVERLEVTIDILSERLSSLLAEYSASQMAFKKKLARIEARHERSNKSSERELSSCCRQVVEPAMIHAEDVPCSSSAPPRYRTQSFSIPRSEQNLISPAQLKSYSFRNRTVNN